MPTGLNSHVYELLPDYVLEMLANGERRQVDEHLKTCPDCQAELARLQLVADDLPLALAQTSPPPRVKENLMQSIQKRQGSRAAAGEKSFWNELAQGLQRRMPALGLALILLLAVSNVLLFRQISVASRDMAAPMRLVSLENTAFSSQASGKLILDSAGKYGTLVVDKLPALDANKQYQVWLIKGNTQTSGGVFSVNAEGYASIELWAPQPLIDYDSVRVSIEPAGGSPQPTGNRVLGGKLRQ